MHLFKLIVLNSQIEMSVGSARTTII